MIETAKITTILIFKAINKLVVEESAKSRGLRGNGITWVKFLRGCVGYVGQKNFSVDQHFTWLREPSNIFLHESNFIAWVQNLLCGTKLFGGSNFILRGSTFFTRRDYFTILQLIV